MVDVWGAALKSADIDLWIDYLEQIDVADQLAFVHSNRSASNDAQYGSLRDWLHYAWQLSETDLFRLVSDRESGIEERLAWATFARWRNTLERILLEPPLSDLPSAGIAQYFGDSLAFEAFVEYRRTGTTVDLIQLLVIPDPRAYSDPILALKHVSTDAQLDLLRRSLATRHKVLVQRNTLIHIDREASTDVFGPSIDTLLLNDWLFETRYRGARTSENFWLFEDPLTKAATRESRVAGTTFIEIGCGNGLLTASFARNEPKILRFVAIDCVMDAISATYRNSARQRMLHRGCIGDRGIYITAEYSPEIVTEGYDLVVCNPPYIPLPQNVSIELTREPFGLATIGTALLSAVVNDAPRLVGPGGMMVIVCSDLATPELLAALPEGWSAAPTVSMVVPFRVQAAQGHGNEEYLRWLVEDRGLTRVPEGETVTYMHVVTVYVLTPDGPTVEIVT